MWIILRFHLISSFDQFVEILTDNSMILLSFLKLEEALLKRTTCFWAITWIEDIFLVKTICICLHTKSTTLRASSCFVEIMNVAI